MEQQLHVGLFLKNNHEFVLAGDWTHFIGFNHNNIKKFYFVEFVPKKILIKSHYNNALDFWCFCVNWYAIFTKFGVSTECCKIF